MKRIIFHIPLKIDKQRQSASQIRPRKMLEAFEGAGFKVDIMEGYGKERKKQIKIIKGNIRKGIKYDFLYSESSTMPTLLTEKHHLPTYPFLDFGFFAFCKKNNIPVGLFYRDIFWCFDSGKGLKKSVAHLFYKYDLRKYKKLLDAIFLPTLNMASYIPAEFPCPKVELPSGVEVKNLVRKKENDKLTILYIGGIGNHYNLQILFDTVPLFNKIELIVCCREEDWRNVKEKYKSSDNIKIVHKKNEELGELYASADIFNIFVEPYEYWKFVAPYKLFEAIGNNIPILSTAGTWVGEFVEKNNIGIVCAYNKDELYNCLNRLVHQPEILKDYRKRMPKVAEDNTWQMRVRTIEQTLKRKICDC